MNDWPIDTVPNPNIKNNLSYTKMINEVNHMFPRKISPSGEVEPQPIFEADTGRHSKNPKLRKSDLE
jgi:hypothetical protein